MVTRFIVVTMSPQAQISNHYVLHLKLIQYYVSVTPQFKNFCDGFTVTAFLKTVCVLNARSLVRTACFSPVLCELHCPACLCCAALGGWCYWCVMKLQELRRWPIMSEGSERCLHSASRPA